MLSMVRSNLYRLAHSVATWGSLITFAAIIVLIAMLLRVLVGDAGFSLMEDFFDGGDATSYTVYGQMLLSGSLIGIFVAGVCEVFFIRDFDNGFIKNLMQIRGGRASYAAAALLTIVVVSAIFLLVGIVVSEIAFRIALFGTSLTFPPIGGLIQWIFQVMLVITAYAAIVVFVVFVTRSNACGLVAVFLLPTGALEQALALVCSNLFASMPALRDCMDQSLSHWLTLLANGPVSDVQLYVTAGAALVVAFVASVIAMVRVNVK